MPRNRKTQSGAPAMPAPKIAPQTYGQGADMQQLDEAMPAPNMQAAPAPSPGPGGTVDAAAPGSVDHLAVLGAAQQLGGQTGLLTRDTNRPQEPITAGLSRGPGAGPEALGMTRGTPTGDILRRLSASTGDPMFAELARKANA